MQCKKGVATGTTRVPFSVRGVGRSDGPMDRRQMAGVTVEEEWDYIISQPGMKELVEVRGINLTEPRYTAPIRYVLRWRSEK